MTIRRRGKLVADAPSPVPELPPTKRQGPSGTVQIIFDGCHLRDVFLFIPT